MRNFYVLMIVFFGFSAATSGQTLTTQSDYIYTQKIDYKSYYQRSPFTTGSSVGVFGLTLQDAADGLPLTLSSISFSITPETGNAISIAALYSNGVKIDTTTVANGATSISFTHVSPATVTDNGTLKLDLRVMFKTAVTDNQQMQFTVSSVTTLASGSQFSAPSYGAGATSSIAGNINKLAVIADRLKFVQQPNDVFAGQVIIPSVTVKATDKNNNIDVDYVTPIKLDITNSIPSCDTLAGNLVTPEAGIATFSNLVPNVADYGVILTTISPLSNGVSFAFDVNSAQFNTLLKWNFSDNNAFADGGTNTNYTSKSIITSSTGPIVYGSCGCIGDHQPAAISTGWHNGSSAKSWQIDFSSLGYWNIKVSSRQRSSPTGPANFKVQYKVGSAGTWLNISTLPALADSFKSSTVTIPELDTNSHVYVRWIMNNNTSISGGTVDAAGESFIDDISILGTSITLARQLNYRSKGSGDFESSCNWESTDTIGHPWVQAHGSPDFSAYGIQIQAGHTITINQTVRIDQLVVDEGATLILEKGQLYVSGGGSVAGSSGLIIKGTFIDNTSGINVGLSFNTGNSWKLESTGTFIKTGTSNPRPYRDFFSNGMSSIPSTAKWILRYNGVNSPTFTTDSTFYPNLTFESTSGLWNPGATVNSYFTGTTAAGAFATVKGNLDIGGTGTGTVKISNVSPNAQPLLVQGNTYVRAGSELNNALGTNYGTGLEIKGNLSTEGVLTLNSGSTGILKMSGSTLQTISGGGKINVRDLTIFNTGAGVLLSRNLTVAGTDSLLLGVLNAGTDSLTLSGPVVRTAGNLNAKLSTTIFNGSAPQTIPANLFFQNTIKHLVIGGNVSLGGQDSLTGTLSFTGSDHVFTTNNYLTLKSTALGTANVAQVINNNSITGNVIVERFISAKRAWRFLSVPTNTTQTVKQAWQEGATSSANIPLPGSYGTQVTDNSATWAAKGFDYYSPDGPSVKKYNAATDTWVGIGSTNNIPAGTGLIKTTEGLMTFVRGDRRSTGIGSAAYATTLRTTGTLYTGTLPSITVNALPKSTGIGNPYASALDVRSISRVNVNDVFIVWDPYLSNSNGNGLGAFQYLYKNGANYYAFPGEGSYPQNDAFGIPTGPSNYIESGQAFFVQSATGGTLTFDEGAKADSNRNHLVLRGGSTASSHLRTNLYAIETDGKATLTDAILNNYSEDFNNTIDRDDAIKATNVAENLSIKNADKFLAIERRHTVSSADTIQLNMLKMKIKSYQFRIAAGDFSQPGLVAFLEDSYFKTRTSIDLNGITIFNFTVINVPGSWNPTRFRIIFKAPEVNVLPVTFSSVKASRQNENVSVDWKVATEKSIKEYIVEKSANGQQFTNAFTVAAKNANSSTTNYQWIDNSPFAKNNYYRIKSIGINGDILYSSIVKVFIGTTGGDITVYPNPVVDGIINLQLMNQPKGIYGLRLLNKSGQVVQVKKAEHAEGSSTESFRMTDGLAHGTYQLEVTKPDNSRLSINLLY